MCPVMDIRCLVFICDKYVAVISDNYVAVISDKYVAFISDQYVVVISDKRRPKSSARQFSTTSEPQSQILRAMSLH